MQEEAIQMVPHADRPDPEDLENYKPEYRDGERDYSDVRLQLSWWLYDYRRKQEQERGRQDGQEPFEPADPDDPLIRGGRRGYNPDAFDSLRKAIQKAPSAPRR